MSEKITHLSDTSFEEQVLQSQLPVLVDYWAEWCGPCKMIAPILEDISAEYADRLTIAKLKAGHHVHMEKAAECARLLNQFFSKIKTSV